MAHDQKHLPPGNASACQFGALLSILDCAVAPASAIYVSAPITTGPRFVEWYRRVGYSLDGDTYFEARAEAVVRPNELAIAKAVQALREREDRIVIEPASLRIEGWEQDHYYAFWKSVIDRFISNMVVLDGWEYSIGCAVEFFHAIRRGIPVVTFGGAQVTGADGRALISRALASIGSGTAKRPHLALIEKHLRELVVDRTE